MPGRSAEASAEVVSERLRADAAAARTSGPSPPGRLLPRAQALASLQDSTGCQVWILDEHGPINLEWIGSAVKRILGQIPNAAASALGAALVGKRWAGTSDEERAAAMPWAAKAGRKGGRSAWAGMSKAEISAEMKRRAAKRRQRA